MTTKSRFDPLRLRELAGDKAFARGEAYFAKGAVTLLLVEPGHAQARVRGTETYRAELLGGPASFEGDCDCRAFSDRGFCKHLVAVGLAANAQPAAQAEAGVLPQLRAWLLGQPPEHLVELLLEQAAGDDALLRRLRAAETLERDPAAAGAEIRAALEHVTDLDETLPYGATESWAADLAEVLNDLERLLRAGQAALVLELAAEALERLEEALEAIDDSEGLAAEQAQRALRLHRDAALAVRPDPEELAAWLFEREIEGGHVEFFEPEKSYGKVLGKAGRAAYRRLAEAAWAALPPALPPKPRRRGERAPTLYDPRAGALRRILDRFAEASGDLEARIALLAKNLSDPMSYLQLAEFCLAQGRPEEALRRAEEGIWLFEDHALEEPLLRFWAERLAEAGRGAEAVPRLAAAFDAAPSRRLYDSLAAAGGETAAAEARALLRERLAMPSNEPYGRGALSALLVAILLDAGEQAEAWRVAMQFPPYPWAADRLLAASALQYPEEALALLRRRVANAIARSAYEEAVKDIRQMAELQDQAAQQGYLAELRERFPRRRKLLAMLP